MQLHIHHANASIHQHRMFVIDRFPPGDDVGGVVVAHFAGIHPDLGLLPRDGRAQSLVEQSRARRRGVAQAHAGHPAPLLPEHELPLLQLVLQPPVLVPPGRGQRRTRRPRRGLIWKGANCLVRPTVVTRHLDTSTILSSIDKLVQCSVVCQIRLWQMEICENCHSSWAEQRSEERPIKVNATPPCSLQLLTRRQHAVNQEIRRQVVVGEPDLLPLSRPRRSRRRRRGESRARGGRRHRRRKRVEAERLAVVDRVDGGRRHLRRLIVN